MKRVVFSSEGLPPAINEQRRFKAWTDLYRESIISSIDLSCAEDRPFKANWEHVTLGDTPVARLSGSVVRFARDRRQVAADPQDTFGFTLNAGSTLLACRQRGREVTLRPADAVFYRFQAEAFDWSLSPDNCFIGMALPEKELRARVPNVEDLVAKPIDPDSPALRHLRRYTSMLIGANETVDDPRVSALARSTLLDLVALVLGAGRDAAELATMRGLRAARLEEILTEIKKRFLQPDFSPDALAGEVGMSPGHVRRLLFETGSTFSERVLELRLQEARTMLSNRANDRMRIIEIALACGFNEISYFNRCFRRRFGATPTEWRGDRRADR